MDQSTGSHSIIEPDATASKADAAVDLTGQTLGDFRIIRRLGEGGMGQVYLAQQVSLKRKVALKVLRGDLAANATALARFKAEAEAVARATHANIVQVYAINEINGLHYMALEYVEGRNLRQYLEKKGPPDVMQALSIIRQVASALQRAMELGIVHRDIKPENILWTPKGEVKVADFGLSRIFGDSNQPLNLTQSGITMGTPLYMSPEQVEGKPIDWRTDIYSFGVTCYHLLTGQPPFRGQSAFDVAIQHVQKQPVPLAQVRPDLPAELCSLVHRMMAKSPDDRIQTGREIVRECARLRDNLVGVSGVVQRASGVIPADRVAEDSSAHQSFIIQVGSTPPNVAFDATRTQPLPRHASRRWLWGTAVVGSVLAAMAAGLSYGWWRNRDAANSTIPPPDIVKATPGLSAQEAQLANLIKGLESGGTPSDAQLTAALETRIKLGLLYLKEWRLNDAEKTFKVLEDDKTKNDYRRNVGLLGRAMVEAFRDNAKVSNELFVAAIGPAQGGKVVGKAGKDAGKGILKDPQPSVRNLLEKQEDLWEMVAKAINHNTANLNAVPPPRLRQYAVPPKAKIGKAPG